MPTPFRPPLNEAEQRILVSLPKLHGAVVNPQYAPANERARLEREFLAWCEGHDRKDWPQWLNDWEIRYRLAHRSELAVDNVGGVRGAHARRAVAEGSKP